jgi:S-adenosylmethionine:diacylglycerol 3-amino-3-carboxypropyl transferase
MDSRLHDDSTPMTCGAWKGKPLDGKSVIQQIGRFAKGSILPYLSAVPHQYGVLTIQRSHGFQMADLFSIQAELTVQQGTR